MTMVFPYPAPREHTRTVKKHAREMKNQAKLEKHIPQDVFQVQVMQVVQDHRQQQKIPRAANAEKGYLPVKEA
jgi:hypothetical protein